MPQIDLATGTDFVVSVHGVTKRLMSFNIKLTSEQAEFEVLDTNRKLRRTTSTDCEITVEGAESGAADAGTFALFTAVMLNQTPLDDIGWLDKSATPLNMIPTVFFDAEKGFPLSEMRVTDVEGGPGGPNDAVTYKITITSGHAV
jgi:hypothetical protein